MSNLGWNNVNPDQFRRVKIEKKIINSLAWVKRRENKIIDRKWEQNFRGCSYIFI